MFAPPPVQWVAVHENRREAEASGEPDPYAVVDLVLAPKATSTLKTRFYALRLFRQWLELRSRIRNHPPTVNWGWLTAGAFDALVGGRTEEARARLGLMLAIADQLSIESGDWTLAWEMTLEGEPP